MSWRELLVLLEVIKFLFFEVLRCRLLLSFPILLLAPCLAQVTVEVRSAGRSRMASGARSFWCLRMCVFPTHYPFSLLLSMNFDTKSPDLNQTAHFGGLARRSRCPSPPAVLRVLVLQLPWTLVRWCELHMSLCVSCQVATGQGGMSSAGAELGGAGGPRGALPAGG